MTEQQLFLAALERAAPGDRGAFLRQACGDDDALLRRIERMLAAFAAGQREQEAPAGPIVERAVEGNALPATTDHGSAAPGSFIAGRYRLLERIGEGGMGEVWVARQTEPVQRKVALKLIRADRDSRQVVARFEAERQALALMDHPNIAKVLDGGQTEGGRPFFVMELVNGLPLGTFCDEAKLTPRERLELFVPICQAVQHAHQKGIVHRDLKPSNILVTLYDGKPVPKIIDFGVAKATGGRLIDESLATQFGAVVGTFEYMAPEQAGFSALDVDTRADIYSLGVVLYELLTGLRPFDGKRLRKAALDEVVRILREEEPPRPSVRLSSDESAPSLASLRQTDARRLTALMRGELDWVVMKCLEKDRNRRYETANGLAQDVQRYLEDEPVQARSPTWRYWAGKFVRRNRGPVVAAAMMLLLLLLGTAVSAWQAWRATLAEGVAEERRGKAEVAEHEAKEERDEAKKQRDRAEHSLYVANMNRVRFEMEHNNLARARALLDLYRRPDNLESDRRGWEWFYWDRMCQGELYALKGHASRVAFNPDGTLLATGGGANYDWTVTVWNTLTRTEVRTWSVPSVLHVEFSPDGRFLACCGRWDVNLWEVSSGREVHKLGVEGKGVFADSAFSPDGRTLAVCDNVNKRIQFWSLPDGKRLKDLADSSTPLRLRYSPDGKVLAVLNSEGVALWDIGTRVQLRTIGGDSLTRLPYSDVRTAITGLAFSPDSRTLATCGRDGAIKLHEVETGKHLRTLTVLAIGFDWSSGLSSVAFSPEGKTLFVAGQRGLLRSCDLASGHETHSFVGHTGFISSIALSRDGLRLAAGSGSEVKVWDATSGPVLSHTLSKVLQVQCSRFSPDGRWLGHSFAGKGIEIQDLGGGLPPRTIEGSTSLGGTFAFSPNGKELATVRALKDPTSQQFSSEIQIWDLNSWQQVRAFRGFTGHLQQQLAFSPDGETLGYCYTEYSAKGVRTKSQVLLLDAATGRERQSYSGEAFAFSLDGHTLAVSSWDGSLKRIDYKRGRELGRLQGRKGPPLLTYSPDGKRLCFGGAMWDAVDGRQLWDLAEITPMTAFSQDGKRLFSIAISGDSGHLRVWDSATGDLFLAARVPPPLGVTIHPDGWRCVLSSFSSGAWLVDVRPLTPELHQKREARNLVVSLFHRPMIKSEVLAFLRDQKTIREEVRQEALALAQQHESDPDLLFAQSSNILFQPRRTTAEYLLAASWAKEALRVDPARGDIASTHGVALYYAEKHEQAVVALESSRAMNLKSKNVRQLPSDYLFLAMTQWRLGRHEEAKANYKRARDSRLSYHTVLPRHWREAEALIEGKKD